MTHIKKGHTLPCWLLILAAHAGCGGGGGGSDLAANTVNVTDTGEQAADAPDNPFTHEAIETDGRTPTALQLAANDAGHIALLWRQNAIHPTTLQINMTFFAKQFDPATGWSPVKSLSSTPDFSFISQIAIDANGDAVAAWHQGHVSTATPQIIANTLIGGTVGTATPLDDHATQPSLTAGPPGGPAAIALWRRLENSNAELKSAEYRLATGWSSPESVPGNTADADDSWRRGFGSTPKIATLDDTRRVTVWSATDQIRANVWSPTLGWSAAAIVATSQDISVLTRPMLVAGGDGRALALWTERRASAIDYRFVGAWFNGATWEAPIDITTEHGILLSDGHPPVRLVADKQGNAMLTWLGSGGLTAARYHDGVWETPVLLNTTGGDHALAVNAQGNTVVVWATGGKLFARGFLASDPRWSEPITIIDGTAVALPPRANRPEIVLDANNQLMVFWTTTGSGLWSSRADLSEVMP